MDGYRDDSSAASSDLDEEEVFNEDLRRVRNNDPDVTVLYGYGNYDIIQNMTNDGWEDLGRDISNNKHLEKLHFNEGALDDERLSSLFRGLSRSSSIEDLYLRSNDFTAAGLRSLEPFLQNSTKLRELFVRHTNIQNEGFNYLWQLLRGSPFHRLDCCGCGITLVDIIEPMPDNLQVLSLSDNNIQSVGFNRLLRSLRDSSVETLYCGNCQIDSIEIDTGSFPKNLKKLSLYKNRINSNGCREIAKLLQEGNITLHELLLDNNLIGDEGAAILADALKTNTTLKCLFCSSNDISRNGLIKMLELVNDVSSINSTLRSNHTLQIIVLGVIDHVRLHINKATKCNRAYPVAAGREKVIQTQLHSKTRAELAQIQGVEHSLYSEINPLHLPEVLSLVSRAHGQGELYLALKASIADVISTVDRKVFLQQRRAHHLAIVEHHVAIVAEIDAELASIESVEGGLGDGNDSRECKRLRL